MDRIGAIVMAAPAPKPAAVRPPHNPRLSGNHFKALPTQVPYTAPPAKPAIAPPRYNIPSEDAIESIYQARNVPTPPASTIHRGPMRSTIAPSNGTSQVSSKMNIE